MNQPYARENQPYATLTLTSALRVFGVQLYKNNAHTLLSRILSILNLDWLQHARSVRGVYEHCLSQFLLDPITYSTIYLFYYYQSELFSSKVFTWPQSIY